MRKVIVRSVWVVAPAAIRAWIGHVVDDTGGPSDSRNDVAKVTDFPEESQPQEEELATNQGHRPREVTAERSGFGTHVGFPLAFGRDGSKM